MKIIIVAALLFVSLVVASDVKVLTESTFDAETASGEWLLEFYAPWCGHCKNLAPKYEELATKVKDQYNIAKIDCTVEKNLQTRFGIRGFPTIKFLKDGKIYDYSGQRTIDSFVDFMAGGYATATANSIPSPVAAAPAADKPAAENKPEAKAGPSDVVTLTADNFALTSQDTWFLEFYAPWCGHCKRLAPIYEEVATALKGKVKVGKVNCDEEKAVCSQYGVRGYPTVYFQKDGELREYNQQRTVEAFKKFAESEWSSVTAEPVPEPVAAWKQQAYGLLGAIESGVGNNMWVVVAACVIVGVILGVLVVACTSSPQAPNKTIHYTAPASSSDASGSQEPEQTEEVANKAD